MSLFKTLRVAILLTILVVVAGSQWLKESHLADWDNAVWVTVYPVIADNKSKTAQYVAGLNAQQFKKIGKFIQREGQRYGMTLPEPVIFQLAGVVQSMPPQLPSGNNPVAIALWSLKMRWWAWRRLREDGLITPEVQIFVLYRSDSGEPVMDRSVGIRKGMYAIVNAFATGKTAPRNQVVMAHELLHVLGASDKYDLATSLPVHPQGYANPLQRPLYPQRFAEIMGGRIALSSGKARMPSSLEQCVIGPATAKEIGW